MPVPDSARYAKDAAEAIGARFEDLDDGDGYLFLSLIHISEPTRPY